MKYIFLLTLLMVGAGVSAATTADFSGGIDSSAGTFGGGLNDTTNSGSDQLGGGNSGSGTLGGGNSGSGSLGDGNSGSGVLGGGSQGPYGNQRQSGYVTPDIGKPTLSIPGIITWLIQIINYLVIGLLTASLLFFLYGVFILMFLGGTNEESRSKGKRFMMWGIVSLFVMVSVWGLVSLLKNSFFGGGPLIGPQFKI